MDSKKIFLLAFIVIGSLVGFWFFNNKKSENKDSEDVLPNKAYDSNGYDEKGFDKDGFDKFGYNELGFGIDGYNRSGFDRNGYNKIGFDINGYDKNGYDKYGYNVEGYDKSGYDKYGNKKKPTDFIDSQQRAKAYSLAEQIYKDMAGWNKHRVSLYKDLAAYNDKLFYVFVNEIYPSYDKKSLKSRMNDQNWKLIDDYSKSQKYTTSDMSLYKDQIIQRINQL